MKKLKNEEEKRFSKWGQEEKGEETLRKPLPTREIHKRGENEEMWRKREKHKKCENINSPRQL